MRELPESPRMFVVIVGVSDRNQLERAEAQVRSRQPARR
jgi:hypothetical protein